ncbi:MAG: hypothetical protein E7672_03145 [Ruminococcaceae bacterium]|nr:hypothetical protein [Oscillospiraceae bacterium]
MKFPKLKLDSREKIIVQRTAFAAVAFILVFFSVLSYSILFRGANYPASVDKSPVHEVVEVDDAVLNLIEPDFSYSVTRLTFGGTCTTASLLGIDAYGTFGHEYSLTGAGHFFEKIDDIFKSDDMTLLGLNNVLSDSEELTQAEKETPEWYIAPASYADIFAEGGVDALSLECERTKDYGWVGYAETKAAVENSGVVWGDSGKAIYKTYDSGISTAYYCSVLRESDKDGIIGWLNTASANHDFVVLYLTDSDLSETPSETKKSLFRAYIDAGADLVVGTNSAVIQPYEEYGDGFIVYSLGTLIDGSSKYGEKYSVLLSVELRSRGGDVVDTLFGIIPIQNYDSDHAWCPEVADSETAEDILANMSMPEEVPA